MTVASQILDVFQTDFTHLRNIVVVVVIVTVAGAGDSVTTEDQKKEKKGLGKRQLKS